MGDAVRFLPVAGGGGGPGGCHGREAPAGAADGIGERVAQREAVRRSALLWRQRMQQPARAASVRCRWMGWRMGWTAGSVGGC